MASSETETPAEALERARLDRRMIVGRYDKGREAGEDGRIQQHIDDWEDPKLEIYHTQDRYGFIHDQRLPDRGRSEREQKQIRLEVSRSQKWAEMIKDEKKYFGASAKHREKMINRVYKGVPDSVRGKVWYILLDIDRIKKEQKGTYAKMRRLARLHSPDIRQIDLDVNRTYRDHVMFRERYNHRQVALFHVLAAYSMYNTEVGYCQGMSQIAALLLMYLNEEEDVFWAVSQLMVNKKYAMHGFFIQGFPKLMRFQAHHDRVLKKFLPKLKKHLDKNGIDTGMYTIKWFFQCFLDRIPFSLTLRVWDLYLLEGERVMIGMGYNILRMHRRYLMRQPMDELIEHLQIHLEKDFGFEDDAVVEKLREVINELASNRLDSPGRPPPEELPQRPFGMLPALTAEEESGLRTGLTEMEREVSVHTIQRHAENERRASQVAALQQQQQQQQRSRLDEEEEVDEDDVSDRSLDETTSIPELNHSGGGGGGGGGARGERLSASSAPAGRPTSGHSHHQHGSGGRGGWVSSDPRAASAASSGGGSDAIDRLDDSVRMMLQAADINGGDDERATTPGRRQQQHQRTAGASGDSAAATPSVVTNKRYSSSSLVMSSTVTTTTTSSKKPNNGSLGAVASSSSSSKVDRLKQSSSEQKMVITKGDVVRIHVPYTPEEASRQEEVTVSTDERTRTSVGGGASSTSPNRRLS